MQKDCPQTVSYVKEADTTAALLGSCSADAATASRNLCLPPTRHHVNEDQRWYAGGLNHARIITHSRHRLKSVCKCRQQPHRFGRAFRPPSCGGVADTCRRAPKRC